MMIRAWPCGAKAGRGLKMDCLAIEDIKTAVENFIQKTKRAITQRVIALSNRLVELAGVEPASEKPTSSVLHA